jgi:hypothetical protein
MADTKSLIMYMKIEFDSKPTDYDKVGCDGLYVKSCEPVNFNKLEKDKNELIKYLKIMIKGYKDVTHDEYDGTSMVNDLLKLSDNARKILKNVED